MNNLFVHSENTKNKTLKAGLPLKMNSEERNNIKSCEFHVLRNVLDYFYVELILF